MNTTLPFAETVSISEAVERGFSAIVRDATEGVDLIIAKRGRPQAVVIGMERMSRLQELESDLQSLALVLSRVATDTGNRTDLDEVLSALGFDRNELQAELDADIKAGRA